MNDTAMHTWSAVEVLDRFQRREVSPVEYLDALVDRIEEIEPSINAVCDRRYDEARIEAAAAAERQRPCMRYMITRRPKRYTRPSGLPMNGS